MKHLNTKNTNHNQYPKHPLNQATVLFLTGANTSFMPWTYRTPAFNVAKMNKMRSNVSAMVGSRSREKKEYELWVRLTSFQISPNNAVS